MYLISKSGEKVDMMRRSKLKHSDIQSTFRGFGKRVLCGPKVIAYDQAMLFRNDLGLNNSTVIPKRAENLGIIEL